MPSFARLVERHGEFGVQAIIERLERYEGIDHCEKAVPLEQRWKSLMDNAPAQRAVV